MQPILVTGGAGFIGGEFVRQWIAEEPSAVVNLDALTYAGNPANLADLAGDPRYIFAQGDIGDVTLVTRLLAEHQVDAIVNFAAESHVDRSLLEPGSFITTELPIRIAGISVQYVSLNG
jgi:dTDP-glucose 4,6-dehydratase